MIEPSTALTAAKAAQTARGFWDRLKPSTKAKLWAKIEKHFVDFDEYLNISLEHASTVNLICSRSINSNLDDVYVPTFLKKRDNSKSEIQDNDLISDIRDGKRVVIRGNGGSGKTLFMKRLWLNVFREPKGKIPVMIELRKFNQFSDVNIISLIRNTLSTSKTISENLFKEMADDGTFFLVFDGFDEVSIEKREAVEAQILEFERLYRKCNIVVSSRPNESFISWQVFDTFDVVPFTRQQTIELIGKVPLDKGMLKRFTNLISEEFFLKYSEFLSSPLLALMMLVTFKRKGDISDISDNIVEFYDNAFHALYSEHDAIKEQFKRPHCLKINDFRLVFSTFCLFSYYKEIFEFKESKIHEYVQKSIDHVNLTKDSADKICCTVEDFLHEILDAVNLMQKDGIMYSFIHRSFQEYFAAYWIINVDTTKTARVLEDMCLRPHDDVFRLCYQMNKLKVDQNYVLPFYDRLISSGLIYKSKPADKLRWQYIESYDFIAEWTVHNQIKLKSNSKETTYIPSVSYSWESGEVGGYYSNIDIIVFNGELRKKFIESVLKNMEASRPSWLIKSFSNIKGFNSKRITARISNEKMFVQVHSDGKSENITSAYKKEYPKQWNKLKVAFDDIENMLHDLNKSVNYHITNIRQGHIESKKSLEEMFF